jgi:hypothetical protein
MAEVKPKGYYHVCWRLDGCWVGGAACDGPIGQWAGQDVCRKALRDPDHYRPCDGPFCSGDSFHVECECNG